MELGRVLLRFLLELVEGDRVRSRRALPGEDEPQEVALVGGQLQEFPVGRHFEDVVVLGRPAKLLEEAAVLLFHLLDRQIPAPGEIHDGPDHVARPDHPRSHQVADQRRLTLGRQLPEVVPLESDVVLTTEAHEEDRPDEQRHHAQHNGHDGSEPRPLRMPRHVLLGGDTSRIRVLGPLLLFCKRAVPYVPGRLAGCARHQLGREQDSHFNELPGPQVRDAEADSVVLDPVLAGQLRVQPRAHAVLVGARREVDRARHLSGRHVTVLADEPPVELRVVIVDGDHVVHDVGDVERARLIIRAVEPLPVDAVARVVVRDPV